MLNYEIKKIENGFLSNNYLIIKDGEAVLIDCACSVSLLKENLQQNKLRAIILTHGHFDHFYTLKQVIEEFGVNVFMHQNCYKKLADPILNASATLNRLLTIEIEKDYCTFIKENKQYEIIKDLKFEFFNAFGHTDDSIITKIDSNLFVGDFVFEDGYGRTDLPTGNYKIFLKYLKKNLKMLKNGKLFYGH